MDGDAIDIITLVDDEEEVNDKKDELEDDIYSFKIDKSELQFGKIIGKGAFGYVSEGVLRNTTKVAIKSVYIPLYLRKHRTSSVNPSGFTRRHSNDSSQSSFNADAQSDFDTLWRDFVNEISVQHRTKHENVLYLHGWSEDDHCVYLIMDFMPFSLSKILDKTLPEYWSLFPSDYFEALYQTMPSTPSSDTLSSKGSKKSKNADSNILNTSSKPKDLIDLFQIVSDQVFQRSQASSKTVPLEAASPKPASKSNFTQAVNQQFLNRNGRLGNETPFISEEKIPLLSSHAKLQIAIDIAEGMHYLHSRPIPIIHRDLKSLNILVTKDLKSLICDFGFAKLVRSSGDVSGFKGTSGWLAPENYSASSARGKESDVYSYGMILYELITHQWPYFEFGNHILVSTKVLAGELPEIPALDQLQQIPIIGDLITLFFQCSQFEPEKRPSFYEVVETLKSIVAKHSNEFGATSVLVRPPNSPSDVVAQYDSIQQAIDCTKQTKPDAKNENSIQQLQTTNQYVIYNTRPLLPTTIKLLPGIYRESVLIDRDVYIIGCSQDHQQVILEKEKSENTILLFKTNRAVLKNLIIRDPLVKYASSFGACVRFVGEGQSSLVDCQLVGVMVHIEKYANPSIVNCSISDSKLRGIHVLQFGKGFIYNSQISNSTQPNILVESFGEPTISHCKVFDGKSEGILFSDRALGLVKKCDIYNNQSSGIKVMNQSNPILMNNHIFEGKGCGVRFLYPSKGKVISNNIHDNAVEPELDIAADCIVELSGNYLKVNSIRKAAYLEDDYESDLEDFSFIHNRPDETLVPAQSLNRSGSTNDTIQSPVLRPAKSYYYDSEADEEREL